MALKKQNFADGEIAIFDEALCTSEVSIGSFACGCLKRTSTLVKAYAHSAKAQQLNVEKPDTKTVTRTVAVLKTKIVKQQTQPQTTPKDTEPTDFTPIHPQPPLPNQRNQ